MIHTSIPLESPIEVIHLEPSEFSPLISKCQIKVCWVGVDANRNGTIITKEVAKKMAPSLRGAAIVGYYNEANEDFEQHNKILEINENGISIRETTRPYGFVDLQANVWFQKFMDEDMVEREYLVTEGYLWTGQYPECQRVIDKGNHQSMELDEELTQGSWTKTNNLNQSFFIINDSVISKLCILGENSEPCFEGSNITNTQYAYNASFTNQLYSLMAEIKEILSKGGNQDMNYKVYSIDINSELMRNIYGYLVENSLAENSIIEGIFETEEGNKFFVCKADDKYIKYNFVEEEFAVNEISETEETFESQFSADDMNNFISNFVGKSEQEEPEKIEENIEEPAPVVEFDINTIPEYQEALQRIATLEQQYSDSQNTINTLTEELNSLREFKNKADKDEKMAMIEKFYMLSEEDKKDVIENIDNYSLDEIEARLSVICVRNKVSFEEKQEEKPGTTTYSLQEAAIDTTPDWIKAVLNTEKELNIF